MPAEDVRKIDYIHEQLDRGDEREDKDRTGLRATRDIVMRRYIKEVTA
jgi:hypothetical protein